MRLDIKGLHFKVINFIDQSIYNGIPKTKLATLAFLYCREFVKNSNMFTTSNVNVFFVHY